MQYRLNHTIILLCIFFLSISTSLSAADTHASKFNHFTYENGLPSNWVTSIVQDQEGFMWFGTSDGLARFDGYDFKVFDSLGDDSIAVKGNFVSDIDEDVERQCLWIVTRYGITKFDKATYTFKNYHLCTSHNHKYSPFSRGSVCVDSFGDVWVEGFSDVFSEGLLKYDEEKDKFINLSTHNSKVPSQISLVYEDNSQRLWIGSKDGLYNYDRGNYTKVPMASNIGDSLYITTVTQSRDGRLWVGTHHDHSIYLLDNDTLRLFYSSAFSTDDYNWISSITFHNNNTLVASVKDVGVMMLNVKSKKCQLLQPDMYNSGSLSDKNIFTLYVDDINNLWVTTYNNGVDLLDANQKSFALKQFNFSDKGLLSNNVRAFFQDSDGDIWVGTKQGGGLSQFYPSTGTFDNYQADANKLNWLDNDIVISINELEKGKLLVGTYGGGIYLFDKEKKNFSRFSIPHSGVNSISDKYVYSIYKDNDGLIWIGANSGVDIYNPITKKFSHPAGITYARCFLDLGPTVLMGTWTKGLWMYNKFTKQSGIYHFNHPNLLGVKDLRINDMALTHDGSAWLATNYGLIKYSYRQDDVLISEINGLPTNDVCAVLLDDYDNVWASTKAGIVKYSNSLQEVTVYDKSDGLQADVFELFVSMKTTSGEMYFAGSQGFNHFYPNKIKDNLVVPKVYISDLMVLNQTVEIGTTNSPLTKHISKTDKITLNHDQSTFSLEYVAVNFTSPEKATYLYMLDGYDEEWRDGDVTRRANYTQVAPGKYVFKVKASNNDGLWNKEAVELEVVIKPHFLASPPAFIIYFVLFVLFLILFQMIVRNNALQKSKLEKEVKEKQRLQEMSRKRIRFFTNISHELRTPLTLIAAPLSRLVNYNTTDKQLLSSIQIMDRNAKRLMRIVNQLMDFRRVEENMINLKVLETDVVDKVKMVLSSFNGVINNRSIKITFKTNSPNGHQAWFDAEILDKILFNLLSNAVKFSDINGEIIVELQIVQDTMIINVIDHGCGIKTENLDKIFERFYTADYADHNISGAGVGLSFTKSLVELHKGEVGVSSTFGEGSCFTVSMPINEEAYGIKEREELHQEQLVEDIIPVQEVIEAPAPGHEGAKREELILIVEDFEDLREYLELNLSNYQTISCGNGKEALKLANERMPDLILSDVMMPEMDGLELCKHIKTSVVTSHIPVVLLSARTSAEQKLEGYVHHADAYIEKPFSIDLLSMQISNIIQTRKSIASKYNSEILDECSDDEMMPLDKNFLDKAIVIVTDNIDNTNFCVESLSAELGMSRSQLFRKFKALTNSTPSQFIKIARLKKAADLLSGKVHNVNEVAFLVGFADSSHFIASFKKYYGLTPKQFAQKNK